MNIPWWFSKKNKAIAEALLSAGFCYSGRIENFSEPDYQERVGQWLVGTFPGEVLISADCDGASFSKSMEDLPPNIDFQFEWKYTKRVIRRAARDWERELNHIQLEIFA